MNILMKESKPWHHTQILWFTNLSTALLYLVWWMSVQCRYLLVEFQSQSLSFFFSSVNHCHCGKWFDWIYYSPHLSCSLSLTSTLTDSVSCHCMRHKIKKKTVILLNCVYLCLCCVLSSIDRFENIHRKINNMKIY